MIILYGLFLFMLITAVGILAVPYVLAKKKLKSYWLMILFFTIFSLALYQVSSNQTALKTWFTQGKQHYELLLQYNALGGIDGIIARIQKKLDASPDDAQGWFILGKLYLAKQNFTAATQALGKATQLQPNNPEIREYYDAAMIAAHKQSTTPAQ